MGVVPFTDMLQLYRENDAVQEKMANLFNANESGEIIFTKNATHSLNQVAKGLSWEKAM